MKINLYESNQNDSTNQFSKNYPKSKINEDVSNCSQKEKDI